MGTSFKKIFFIAVILLLAKTNYYSQFTVTSTTACPNQTVVLAATWNNVGSITYTISRTGFPITVQTSPNFTVSDAGPANVVYSFTAQGTALSGPVTATASATLTIVAAPALALTQPNNGNYCHNGTATITAPIGSVFNYSITGPTGNYPSSTSNIINIPNLVAATHTGQYTVTANISGCVRRGTTQVNVAPNSTISLSIGQGTNICKGTSINITATLPNVDLTSMYWTRPDNTPVFPTPANVLPVNNAQAADNGMYKVNSNFFFNSITCPAPQFTTMVTVVQTSTINIVASPSKTVCQGANITLNANTAVTGGGYSWSGPLYTSSAQNPTLTGLAPINSGNYSVTALFFNASITCTTSAVINISVIPTSVPSPIANPNVCQGAPATLSVTASGAPTYSWSGPNNYTAINTGTVITIPNMQPIQSGPYFVTATYGSASTTLCALTRSVVVNVVPVNTITVIPPADVCQPDNAFLQASAIGATSFTWTGPNGNVGSTANVTLYHPFTSASGIYTITMGFGGSALTCYAHNTVSLTVKPLLNFTLPSLINNNYCVGDTLKISGPSGATSYSWTSSTGYAANTQNINIFPLTGADAGEYYLAVSLNGCITTATTSMRVRSRIVFSEPIPDKVICRGDSIHLEAHVAGGPDSENGDGLACTWNPPIYLTNPNRTKTDGRPLGTTIYNVSIHDISCPYYTISKLVQITVNQPPTPHLELERTESCEPLCMVYNTQTHGTATLITYDFGGNKKYQLADSSSICLEEPGTYNLNVHLYGVNGCTVSYNYPQQIIVNPKPHSEIVVSPEFPTITDDVTFHASTKYPTATYYWQLSTSNSAPPDTFAVQSFNKVYENAGKYPVLLISTTEQGCSDTAVKYIDVRDDFNVFIPNTFTPNGDNVNDVFQVKSAGLRTEGFSMQLLNRWGREVYFTKDLADSWDGTIGGQKAPVDVYIYKVRVIGAGGEGRKEYVGRFSLVR